MSQTSFELLANQAVFIFLFKLDLIESNLLSQKIDKYLKLVILNAYYSNRCKIQQNR